MLADLFSSTTLRQIGRGELDPEIWITLESSGFLDALVCEESGGANLSFATVLPLFLALGRRAVPPPVGETIVARALLAQAGRDISEGRRGGKEGGCKWRSRWSP